MKQSCGLTLELIGGHEVKFSISSQEITICVQKLNKEKNGARTLNSFVMHIFFLWEREYELLCWYERIFHPR
jgi:hypothetical protein